MVWHYLRDGTTQGPIDQVELQRLRAEGLIQADTPVWTEGMAAWTPYQQTTAAGSAGATVVPAVPLRPCVECGKTFPEDELLSYEGKWVCATCKPLFFQRLKEGLTSPGTLPYATIGRRFSAVFLDGIIIDIVIFVPLFILLGASGVTARGRVNLPAAENLVIVLFQYLLPALYEILMIGKFGATLGKMAMSIKVVTPEGQPISYGRSVGRYFGKMLSGIILGIGYFMAFWDPEKRALHDRICHTRVISAPRS